MTDWSEPTNEPAIQVANDSHIAMLCSQVVTTTAHYGAYGAVVFFFCDTPCLEKELLAGASNILTS